MAPPPAIVVGLDNITGLQTARILAARGVPVIGIAEDRRHFGARTRVCLEIIEADRSSEAVVDTLLALGDRIGGRSVLIPCTDLSVSVLSRCRDRLTERFWLPLAPHDVVSTLLDKARFAEYATQVGLPVPRTELLETRADAERMAARLTFPALVKPAAKSLRWYDHTSAKGILARDNEELLSVYDRVHQWCDALLVQEWVEGGEESLFSCNCYFDRNSTPLVTFVARKVRQWPPDVGTSASGEECRNDEVLQAALALFGSIRFHGLAYLEMKRDSRTGRMLIIEPNVGRPTGRSAIAEGGGVELVYTAYCDAAGLPLPLAREQRYVGTKWLDLRRDLQAAAVARRRGELSIGQWLRSLRGPKAHAIWSSRDPGPFVADLTRSTSTGVRMLVRRMQRRRVHVTRSASAVPVKARA